MLESADMVAGMDVRIDFDGLPWESPSPGIRFKTFSRGAQQLRLLEFSDGFEEREWCTKGHAFHVLEGAFSLHLPDRVVRLRAGDTGFLGVGEGERHKAVLGDRERVRLLLFEVV
jgi:quercetin dioxygenase-like cupin family protein